MWCIEKTSKCEIVNLKLLLIDCATQRCATNNFTTSLVQISWLYFVFWPSASGQHEQAATTLFWIFNGQKRLAMICKNPSVMRPWVGGIYSDKIAQDLHLAPPVFHKHMCTHKHPDFIGETWIMVGAIATSCFYWPRKPLWTKEKIVLKKCSKSFEWFSLTGVHFCAMVGCNY